MWPLVADVPWCVCLLDITVSSAKTAETIEMPFAVLTMDAGGPKEPCIRWCLYSLRGAIF